jgi:hypothetical protein
MRTARAIIGVLAAGIAASVTAQTTIDATDSFAWGESIGWINFRGDTDNGVAVFPTHLEGFAWSESFGWINLGDGPDDNVAYTQSATDFGVNNDGAGNLSGYAWGENIGWIVFDTSADNGSQVTIDGDGQFQGYAWGENVGWISMNSGYGVVTLVDDGEREFWMVF